MSSLTIIPIPTKKHKEEVTVNPLLPEPPFMECIVAPRNSGKSTMQLNKLCREDMYANYFDSVHIYSPTVNYDENWKSKWVKQAIERDDREVELHDEFDKDYYDQIIEEERELINLGLYPRFWHYFDDMITQHIMSNVPTKLGPLETQAARGRHERRSISIVSQKFKSISNPIRLNTLSWFLYECVSTEADAIAEHLCGHLTKNQFKEIYNVATQQRYHFLYVDLNAPRELRYRHNFDIVLQYVS